MSEKEIIIIEFIKRIFNILFFGFIALLVIKIIYRWLNLHNFPSFSKWLKPYIFSIFYKDRNSIRAKSQTFNHNIQGNNGSFEQPSLNHSTSKNIQEAPERNETSYKHKDSSTFRKMEAQEEILKSQKDKGFKTYGASPKTKKVVNEESKLPDEKKPSSCSFYEIEKKSETAKKNIEEKVHYKAKTRAAPDKNEPVIEERNSETAKRNINEKVHYKATPSPASEKKKPLEEKISETAKKNINEKVHYKPVETNESKAASLNGTGMQLTLANKHEQAIGYFDSAIELNQTRDFYNNRAYSKLMIEDYAGSIKDYTEAIRRKSYVPLYWLNRGHAYRKSGKDQQAYNDWRKAVELGSPGAEEAIGKYFESYSQNHSSASPSEPPKQEPAPTPPPKENPTPRTSDFQTNESSKEAFNIFEKKSYSREEYSQTRVPPSARKISSTPPVISLDEAYISSLKKSYWYDPSIKFEYNDTIRYNGSSARYFALDTYYPVRYKSVPTEVKNIRSLIFNFKDGKGSASKVANQIASAFCNSFVALGESGWSKNLTIAVIPASTKLVNEKRYRKFCSDLSGNLKCINGYNAITIKQDRKALKGQASANKTSNLRFDHGIIKGRIILLIDDVITSGGSYIENRNILLNCGAKEVIGIFLGRTFDGKSGDPYWFDSNKGNGASVGAGTSWADESADDDLPF